jgi:hypothetical protein
MKAQWKVEMTIGAGSWDDAGWTCNDSPLLFDTQAEAEQAIDDFIAETEAEAAAGNLAEAYARDGYRAEPFLGPSTGQSIPTPAQASAIP